MHLAPCPTSVLLILASLLCSTTYFRLPSPFSDDNPYHSLFLSSGDNATTARHLLSLTSRPHTAGTPANYITALYVLNTFSLLNFQAHVTPYKVSLTYPIFRSLDASFPATNATSSLSLQQEPCQGDPYSETLEALPTFHAYAKTGQAIGEAIYVNYGRERDYALLKSMGLSVEGKVVLARYGEIFRGDIVNNAMEEGAIGVVIYTDPKDYGGDNSSHTEARWMPPSGVQMGAVYRGIGDPSTPGWASIEGCERLERENMEKGLPSIPSLPISAKDAKVIVAGLEGPLVDEDWQGGIDVGAYRVGPGPVTLNLTYIGELKEMKIHNVFAVIKGAVEPDRYVLMGNHRDAWIFGAVDPNSGTAAMLEIAQRLSKLQKRGWRPRRSIILCSWDAEEYGLIGSTEWVEENSEMMGSKVVAYLNVDTAVSGAGFHASATPQLDHLLKEATQEVKDPDNSSRTVYDSWIESGDPPLIGRLGGGGSDYAAFLQHIGIPAVDMGFKGAFPVYHSLYDNFVWMKKFGDPSFQRNVAVGSIWGLVALRLADEEFLPFNYSAYASELHLSTKALETQGLDKSLNFSPLYNSIKELEKAAGKIMRERKALEEDGWASRFRKENALLVRDLNDRLMMAERAFADPDGLFGRSWHKHLVYGPSKHNDYGSRSFPGIEDAIEEGRSSSTRESWAFVQHQIWRASRVVSQASLVLRGDFT
ncbi:probable glutamate carboxypeptidase LAMP1 [Amborella trichopoda]|uniref:probable glutamate carboxypeptidase LAMP1 n=1 Tax=Amborella trichopoda TaxID=13333 RepID=UPI0009BC998C|nr:probable glutamate carboxypeptidase LAMP1 [Amborella trichopoda]|eukprot:XP_011626765.2 probable glutamate carboxypeptidase LAMP1 [Amborella trichopoda]